MCTNVKFTRLAEEIVDSRGSRCFNGPAGRNGELLWWSFFLWTLGGLKLGMVDGYRMSLLCRLAVHVSVMRGSPNVMERIFAYGLMLGFRLDIYAHIYMYKYI